MLKDPPILYKLADVINYYSVALIGSRMVLTAAE